MSPEMEADAPISSSLASALESFDPANHRGPRIAPNWGRMTDMLEKDKRLDGADRFVISVQLISVKPLPGEAPGDTVARVVEQYLAEKATPKPGK